MRRRLGSALLLLFALYAGMQAQDLARADAQRQWDLTHFPSEVIWNHALGSRGFTEVRDPKLTQRALRTIPAEMDQRGNVWITGDARWVVVFGNPGDTRPGWIYCIACELKPEGWSPAGNGWPGFEAALGKVDQAKPRAPALIPLKKPRRRGTPVDPREIRY